MSLTKSQIVNDLKIMGIAKDDIVNVKASLLEIGYIKGGANTLIEALLECVGQNGTILSDSFVNVYSPWSIKFWSNIVTQTTPSYAGALANAMITFPGSFRSNHPVQKFSLIGKEAEYLAGNHTSSAYAYDILRIIAEKGGKNLKIGSDEKVPGVGTTHVAIGIAKIRQKRLLRGVRYKNRKGVVTSFYLNWSGGCMEAFYQLNEKYKMRSGAILKLGNIGSAKAKLTSMKDTLELELYEIKRDINGFLRCGNQDCLTCSLTWENNRDPISSVIIRALKSKDIRLVYRILKLLIFGRYPFKAD